MLVALIAAQTTEETHRTLPMPPLAFGACALGVFALLLFVTWSFRNVGKHH